MNNSKKQAIEWLKAGKDDLDSISYIINVEHLTNIISFHAQQAIEKSFKSLLEYKKISIIKTHNLERLYREVKEYIEVEDYDKLELINELYIDSRYPGDIGLLPYGKPTLEDAKKFYEFANDIFNKVCEILDVKRDRL